MQSRTFELCFIEVERVDDQGAADSHAACMNIGRSRAQVTGQLGRDFSLILGPAGEVADPAVAGGLDDRLVDLLLPSPHRCPPGADPAATVSEARGSGPANRGPVCSDTQMSVKTTPFVIRE